MDDTLPVTKMFPRILDPKNIVREILDLIRSYTPFQSRVFEDSVMPPGTGVMVAPGDFIVASDVLLELRSVIQNQEDPR